MKISIDKIDGFIFDFDGVLTDNRVFIDQNGIESVVCNRADGLGFDALRKLNKYCFILSSEKNPVVKIRADKLQIKVIQGVVNKTKAVKDLAISHNLNLNNILYIGNDLNDYNAMKICGYSACPADSHTKIKDESDFILKANGGDGVVRCLLENILNLDLLEILYKN